MDKILEGLPGSMVRRRIHTLYKIRQMHSLSTDLMNRLDQLEETKNYRFLKFVTSILLILGLLGTVFGLSISVLHIAPAIQEAQNLSDIIKLGDAMAHTIGGLQTAFNTTLVALVATFIIYSLVLITQRYEGAYFHHLEYFTTYDIMPKILITSEMEASTLYVEAIEKSAKDISRAAEVLDKSRDGIAAIVDGLLHSTMTTESRIVDFFNFAQSFKDSVGQLMGYKDQMQVTYDNIEKVLREIKDNQMTDQIIGEIVDKSVARSITATNETAEVVRESFKKDVEEIVEFQKQYAEAVNKASEAIKEFGRDNSKRLTETVIKGFDEALKKFKEEFDQLQKQGDISRMIAMENVEQFQVYMQDSTKNNQSIMESMADHVKKLLQTHVEGATRALTKNQAAMESVAIQIPDFLNKMALQSGNNPGHLKTSDGTMSES